MGFKARANACSPLLRGIEHYLVQRNEIADNPLNDLLRCWGNAIPKGDFQGLCRAKTQFMRTIDRELDLGGHPSSTVHATFGKGQMPRSAISANR